MPPSPPRPACSNHSAPLPLSSQDQDSLLTPTQKWRARRKRALQSAASIYVSDTFPVTPESTEIPHVSPKPVKSTDVISQTYNSVAVLSESVESTSGLPEIVKSTADLSIPVTPEPFKPTPVIRDPVKPAPVTPEPVKPTPVTPESVTPIPVIYKMAKLAAIQSVPVNSKPESTSGIPESVTFTAVIQEQVVSTTVITQSMKFALGISESAKSTSVFPETTECTLVTQESVKSNVISQSVRSVPDLSQSAGPIPVSAEMTRITASPPVLAELATDTTETVKCAVSIRQKRKTARAVKSQANESCLIYRMYSCLSCHVHGGSSCAGCFSCHGHGGRCRSFRLACSGHGGQFQDLRGPICGMGVHKCIRYGQLACFGRHYECWEVYKGFRATYALLQMTSISGKVLCISAGQCKTTYCSYYNSMAS